MFRVIRKIDFNRATELNFLTPFPVNKMQLFSYIILRLNKSEAWFSNWAEIFRMLFHVNFLLADNVTHMKCQDKKDIERVACCNWDLNFIYVSLILCLDIRVLLNLLCSCFLFVWFDSLRPGKQVFSHVGTSFPGLNKQID